MYTTLLGTCTLIFYVLQEIYLNSLEAVINGKPGAFGMGSKVRGEPKQRRGQMGKRKDVSILVSAAGWLGSFIGELIPALRERGISDEKIHAFVNDNGKISVEKIADVMAEDIQQAEGVYPTTFDYSEPVEEKVTAGRYDWSNNDITSAHFPTKRTGTVKSGIKLFHFNRNISSEEAIQEMDKEGYRPAEACELLDFGKKHPDVQREFPIVALGSVWRRLRGRRFVVCLGRDVALRLADLSFGSGSTGLSAGVLPPSASKHLGPGIPETSEILGPLIFLSLLSRGFFYFSKSDKIDLDSRLKTSFRLWLETVEFRSYLAENGAG